MWTIQILLIQLFLLLNASNSFHVSPFCFETTQKSRHSLHQSLGTVESVVGNIYSSIDEITFVSSNINKIKEVKLLLGTDFPWKLNCESLELPEPQASPVEISIAKCKRAAELCNGPVIVEDTSLCFNALNGLPGPYIKWFYESIGNEGLAKMLDGFDDKSAYAQCVLSFTLGKDRDVKTFVGAVDGEIINPQGEDNFGWDQIFRPLGSDKTFAQMSRAEKNKISHRFKAFREFKAFLNSRAGS